MTRTAHEKRVSKARLLRLQAHQLLKEGRIQAAADLLWESVETHKKDATSWHKLALLYRDHSDSDHAIEEVFKKTFHVRKDSAVLHADYALFQYKIRRIDSAVEHLEKSIELSGTPWWVYRTLGLIRKEEGLLERAHECLMTAYERRPDDPITLYGLFSAYLRNAGFLKAEKYLEFYLREINLSLKHEDVLRYLISKRDARPDAWMLIADILFYNQREQEGIDAAYTAAAINGSNADLWYTIYEMERYRGNEDVADDLLTKITTLDSDHQMGMRESALWWWRKGLIYDSEKYILEYLQKFPDDDEMRQTLGEVYERMDLFEAEMREMDARATWEEHHSYEEVD